MWGYVDGSVKKPADSCTEVKEWNKNNAKVMSWIVSSVKPQIGTNLRVYKIAIGLSSGE